MKRLLCALAMLVATAVHATLEQRDLDANGTVDAYFDSSTSLTWQAEPQSFNWFVRMYAGQIEVAGVTGWQLPTVAQLDSLVFDALGNTAASFEAGTANAGPFGRWFCYQTWAADLGGTFADEAGLFVQAARAGGGTVLSYLYDYRPAWLVIEGDVGSVSPAPEPTTWALMGVGLAVLAAVRARSQAAPAAPR
jgi:hypothetical protein